VKEEDGAEVLGHVGREGHALEATVVQRVARLGAGRFWDHTTHRARNTKTDDAHERRITIKQNKENKKKGAGRTLAIRMADAEVVDVLTLELLAHIDVVSVQNTQ
jgi:hypothetical protein